MRSPRLDAEHVQVANNNCIAWSEQLLSEATYYVKIDSNAFPCPDERCRTIRLRQAEAVYEDQ